MNRPRTHSRRQSRAVRLARWLVGVASGVLALWSAAHITRAAAPDAAGASGFQVIVHPSNPVTHISYELLMQAFFKRTTRWNDGQTIRPVDLRADSPVRREFSNRVLKRSVMAVRSYWQQRIFSGRELPPPELDSDAAVLRFVQSSPGAIGYVSANTHLTGVKHIPVY
jgi:ABC-type phosphate transport system substrate-binding protein